MSINITVFARNPDQVVKPPSQGDLENPISRSDTVSQSSTPVVTGPRDEEDHKRPH